MKLKLITSLMISAGAIAAHSAALAVVAAAPTAASLTNCCTPTDADFPMVGGNLGGQNYSSLKQVTRTNIKNLGAVWLNHVEGGLKSGSQSTPIAVDGVIFLETSKGNIIAVDGATGATKWRNDLAAGTRRGMAASKAMGAVFTMKGSTLYSLDINTGAVNWSAAMPARFGGFGKVALVYTDSRLFVSSNDGTNGAGLTVDATNGAVLNAFFGVAKNLTDEGANAANAQSTWGGDLPMSSRSGGTPWIHPAVDPELHTVFWAFGNNRSGSSQDGSRRPGQNLFADSLVAVDYLTGAYKWHFQGIHHDVWDMDNMNPVIAQVTIAGQPRKVVYYGSKVGRYYVLDANDGTAPLGIDEVPVPVNVRNASYPTQPFPRQGAWAEQCAVTEPLGGPVPGNPSRAVPNYPVGCLFAPHADGAPVLSFPGHGGAGDWAAKSFSQSTKLIYAGMGYVGASHSWNEGSNGLRPPGEYMTGAIVAVDAASNQIRWKKYMPYSMAHGDGILTTASDLLFIGQPDGNLLAMDANNGRELWRFQTGAAISSTPITYMVGGDQYVAVYASGTGIPYGTVPNGDSLYAFKIGGTLPQAPTPTPPTIRRPISGNAVTGASVSNTVLLGRSSAVAAEQSINSGSTNGMFPTFMTVPVGTTVTFTNPASSAFTHCATQFFEGLFNFSLAPGASATYTFTTPGEFFYNDCQNPRSTGKVVVQ